MLLDLHPDFQGGRSGGLVFPSLEKSQFVVIHTVKGFGIVNKAEIDGFLELSCFFQDTRDVCILISGSSAFSKSSLNIWKFTVHMVLKPGMEDFEHLLACEMTKNKMTEEALQIAVRGREMKSKGENKRYTYLNAEFQRIARRDKKDFLSDQCKEIEENDRINLSKFI